jgi:hypothetical protein
MNRLAWITGALLALAGPAFAQDRTMESPKQEETHPQTPERKPTDMARPAANPATSNPAEVEQNQRSDQGPPPALDKGATKPTGEAVQHADEPKKHLTAVELYIRSAVDNSKALYEAAQLPQGPTDRALFKEVTGNINRDIAKAQQHIAAFRKFALQGTTSSPEQRATEPGMRLKMPGAAQARPEDVLVHLKQAHTATSRLSSSLGRDRAQVRGEAAKVYTHLAAASDALRDLLRAYDVTALDRVSPPERMPVKGVDSGDDFDHDRSLEPDRLDHGMAPGKTPIERSQPPGTIPEPAPQPDRGKQVPKTPSDY